MPSPTPRVVRLALLDTYGVRWSLETFARDLLQNFFDAAPDFRDVLLRVDRQAGTVDIHGPVVFDLDLLAYIGATTKQDGRSAGGFGEGFKICVLVGLRDFGLRITAGSGELDLEVFLDPVALGRELCYRVNRRNTPYPGSFVRLEGCSADCCAVFEGARRFFRHRDNPHLLVPLLEDEAQGVALYPGPRRGIGEIYYRRQLRGTVRYYGRRGEQPLTLVHDGVIDGLEGDRDRRDLPGGPVARAIGLKLEPALLHRALLHLTPYWTHGCETLGGLLEAAKLRKLCFDWPTGWLARLLNDQRGLNQFAERQGYTLAVHEFSAVGMKTPADRFKGDLETRAPTGLELARFQVLAGLYRDLNGSPSKARELQVFDDHLRAAVHGQYFGESVLISAKLLRDGFDASAGTVLHELSHEAGGDSAPAFLKRLKRLLDAAVRHPETVAAARTRFAEVTEADALTPDTAPEEPPVFEPTAQLPRELLDREGVPCTLVVAPAFPPAAELLERLRAASLATGVPLRVYVRTIANPADAVSDLAMGLPTLRIGPWDLEEGLELTGTPSLSVRTFDGDVVPSVAMLERAIRRAADAGMRGERGVKALEKIEARGWELRRQLAGQDAPPPPPPDSAEARRRDLRLHALKYAGTQPPGSYLRTTLHAMGEHLAQEWADDPRPLEEVCARIRQALIAASTCARTLEQADPTFDDASDLEIELMAMAKAVAIAVHVQAPGGEGPARAAHAFAMLRTLTEEILDLDLASTLKKPVLEHALSSAGLSRYSLRPAKLQLEALRPAFDHACAVARQLDRAEEEKGHSPSEWQLQQLLRQGEERAREAERKRVRLRDSRRSGQLRAIWDETLHRTGSRLEAAAAHLEAVPRIFTEVT